MTYYINQLREGNLTNLRYTDSIHTLDTMTSLQRRNSFRGNNFFTIVKHDLFLQYYQNHPKTNDPADFVQLLVSMSSAQCSDDRDRIFALNSLGGRPTEVNYTNTTEAVFTRFAIEECTYSLETLYCCGAFSSTILPSFVPDWRSPRQWIPLKSFEGRLPSQYPLSETARLPNSPPHRPVFIDSRMMIVYALPLTRIATKGPALQDNWHTNPWRLLGKILKFYAHRDDLESLLIDPHCLDQLMKTLTSGAIRSGTHLDGWLQFGKTSQSTWQACDLDPTEFCNCGNQCFCEYPQTHTNNYNILQRIERLMQGRCTFKTERGDWGIGPASMLLGDQIFTFPDCQYPLVLRPSPPGVGQLTRTQYEPLLITW
jgi:hypothetical protein